MVNSVYHGGSATKPGVAPRTLLVLACGAQLMVVLDGLIVSVALPAMRVGLQLSAAGQQWVVDGYLITFGGLLVLAARTIDLIGHRRVFLSGVAIFTVASLAGGLATDSPMLIAARLAQGCGAAALAPSSLSLLTMTYTGQQRAKALSLWSATSASAGALGLVLGGVITSGLGWRWVLLVNVPIGAALWLAATKTLAPTRPAGRRDVDIPGALSVTASVATLTYAISQAHQSGWTATRTVTLFAVAAALLALFIAVERRAAHPLVPLSIVRRRNVAVANLAIALVGAVMTATLVILSLYEQHVLGQSALRTGLALVPMSVVLTAGAIASKSLLPRFGARRLVGAGGLSMTAALAWCATLPDHSAYLNHLLGPSLLWAAGASIVTMPCVTLATSDVDVAHAGLASGLVNMSRQVGGALGLAVIAAVASTATADSHAHTPSARTVHGYNVALLTAGVLTLLVSLCAAAARTPQRRSVEGEPRSRKARATAR